MLKRVALMGVLLFVPASATLADFKSGLTAYNKGDFETAVKEWQGPAEQGHAQALNGLGFLYMNGQGVAQDDTRALGYFLIAAKRNFAAAQYNAGILYSRIKGAMRNQRKASEWIMKAAEQGHVGARYQLAGRYENGTGVDKDFVEALRWAILAAEGGKGRLKEQATSRRDRIKAVMQPSLIQQAEQRAAETKGK